MKLKYTIYILIGIAASQAGFAAPGFIESIKKQTDPLGVDLFLGFDTASISTKLDLENEETGEVLERETISGIGIGTVAGAHFQLRNARGTGGVSLLYDGIPPSEEDGTFGANITKVSAFGSYDHLIPFTFHPNFRSYISGGLDAGYGMYSEIHTLRWGMREARWEDQTKFETTARLSLTLDYALNNWLAVEVVPFMEFNLGFGTQQTFGSRFVIRSF